MPFIMLNREISFFENENHEASVTREVHKRQVELMSPS